MSRTIHHEPLSVRRLSNQGGLYEHHDHRYGDCDLIERDQLPPRRELELNSRFRFRRCTWDLLWHEALLHASKSAPQDYRRLGWLKPARQAARQGCHAAKRDYNAGYEPLDGPEPYRHRHGGRYAWD